MTWINLRWLLAGSCLLSNALAWAAPPPIEIKGLRIGMSEAEFLKLYPSATCVAEERKPSWDASVPTVRRCSMPEFSVANKKAKLATFSMFEGRLGLWSAMFGPADRQPISDALAEKFGPPKEQKPEHWSASDVSLYLIPMGTSLTLMVYSNISTQWDEKRRAVESRKAQTDM